MKSHAYRYLSLKSPQVIEMKTTTKKCTSLRCQKISNVYKKIKILNHLNMEEKIIIRHFSEIMIIRQGLINMIHLLKNQMKIKEKN